MKIEVGDIVNTLHSKEVIVKEVFKRDYEDYERIWFIDEFGSRFHTRLSDCTLVKKGEKEMEEVKFKAIEAYKLMEKGSIMKGDNGVLYRVVDGTLHSKCGSDSDWTGSCVLAEVFFKMKFTEYKEPLKYKVGDEVWVKAKVKDVRTDQDYAYPYVIEELSGYYKEEELKGIDE
ncbi:hypothetical protein COL75_16615 [Bacillus wiedmannii]|uniref:hypothetical protein n=1 Tax=Bacillus wiedmannii TaxID=1890302 RepID=UPI000BF82763|nr:hypothetical protein [Bacillus wiedmannii]PFZ02333.1 hypothetical protein COL75_16615 [Bacillus wiedmannii]